MNKAVLPAALIFLCAACRQDMQDQPKYKPLSLSHFFADGRSARPIPAHTIAIDDVGEDPGKNTGMNADGSFVTNIPVPVTAAFLERGQERFDIYCSPCHGRTGRGMGMVSLRGFKTPADLNSDRVRNAPHGYIFAVITSGYGAMPDYSYQIPQVSDRWAVVAYIRALQLSRQATLDDVPAEARTELERQP